MQIKVIQHFKLLLLVIIASLLVMVFMGALYLWVGFRNTHEYDLATMAKYKTTNFTDDAKVSAITELLPLPDHYYSHEDNLTPGGPGVDLMIRYHSTLNMDFPIFPHREQVSRRREVAARMISAKNALVLFTMIDDLQVVSFIYSGIYASDVGLGYVYQRADFEAEYGDLTVLANDIDKLEEILAKDWVHPTTMLGGDVN